MPDQGSGGSLAASASLPSLETAVPGVEGKVSAAQERIWRSG